MKSHHLAVAALVLLPLRLSAQAAPPHGPEIVPQPATTLPLKHAAQPTTAAITAADLMTRLYIFADDSMQGREAGTIGNVKGTDYIAGEAKRIGLKPMGDNGSFFQTLPLKSRALDTASRLTVDGANLVVGSDWSMLGFMVTNVPSVGVIFGGVLGDTAAHLTPAQTDGKIVLLVPPPSGISFRALGAAMAASPGAVAIGFVAPDPTIKNVARPGQFVDDGSNDPGFIRKPLLFVSTAAAAKLLGAPVMGMTAGTAGKTVAFATKFKVELVTNPARNVVGVIPGSDPKLRGQFVAIGGHNDHIGFSNQPVDHDSMRIFTHIVRAEGAEDGQKRATPDEQLQVNQQLAAWRTAHPGTARLDSIYNGADDDGTGSVSVLEIAEKVAAMNPKPKRSILFVWHVGEEKGLWGSEWFTDHPTVSRDSIVAQLNIDMVGRGDAWDVTGTTKDGEYIHGNPDYLQLIGSRRLSTELGNLMDSVNIGGKHNLKFDYALDADGHPLNIYCRSDHYEYARYGIPIVFFTTGGHSDYHQLADEPEYIDYDHMARIDNFIADALLHVANLDHRVVVDHPKPDPKGQCRQ
ncbi:MAG TPA: M28 family peptidase [Gemmatimonadales bacterium]